MYCGSDPQGGGSRVKLRFGPVRRNKLESVILILGLNNVDIGTMCIVIFMFLDV